MTVVSIVIPYFQRRPGILRRALSSVLAQTLPNDVRVAIIVVDDGSPVPARAELEQLHISSPFTLALVEQPNCGVAAARNAALRKLSPDTTYVAFLDSDDVWTPDYLATAISALDGGHDFFFCNGRRLGEPHSVFEDASSGVTFNAFLSDENPPVIGDQLCELESAKLFSRALRGPPYRIPAVVYRRAVAPELTFDTSVRDVGEDSVFLLELILRSRKICCCFRELALFADGVNICAGNFGWDNPGHLLRHMGAIHYFYKVRACLPLVPQDRQFVRSSIRLYRRVFAFLSIRYFIKKRERWSSELVDMARRDPAFWFWYPLWALYVTAAYPLGIYNPIRSGDIYHPSQAGGGERKDLTPVLHRPVEPTRDKRT